MDNRQNRPGRRVSSLSKGFGISVIATPPPVQQLQAPSSRAPQNRESRERSDEEAECSMISSSTIGSVADTSVDSQVNTADGLGSAGSGTNREAGDPPAVTGAELAAALAGSSLRRHSFNRGTSHPGKKNLGPAVKTGGASSMGEPSARPVMSQRFRSTPALVSSETVTPPPPLPKSTTSSPYLNQHPRQGQIRSSTTIRLPRRRSTQQLTKKQKDKRFDDDNDTLDDSNNDVLMYNVPIASCTSLRMFQNANAMESREALRKAWNESESNLIIPPSPLPGSIGTELNSEDTITPLDGKFPPLSENGVFESPSLRNNPSFNALSPTAQQLSTFYEFSSHTQAEEELKKRKEQPKPSTADPELLSALDDLSLASSEKLSKLSVTRPSWIPPKDQAELHRHEVEFKKMVEHSSRQALKQSKHQVKIEHEKVIGDARLKYLSEKSQLTPHNCAEVRKYILITDIDTSVKYLLFRKLMIYKLGTNIFLSPPFVKNVEKDDKSGQNFPDVEIGPLFANTTVDISPLETSSLQTILQPLASPVPSNTVDISKLPKIPAVPIQTLLTRLARIALILLRNNYTTPQVRDIIYWLHAHIFTVKFKESFTKTLSKGSVVKLFKDFKDDYSILTIPTALDLILDLSNRTVCKSIELLLVFWSLGGGRGAKMFVALVLCIIKDYHFGWNNLQVIFHSKAHVYIGDKEDDMEKFFKHVLKYYALIG